MRNDETICFIIRVYRNVPRGITVIHTHKYIHIYNISVFKQLYHLFCIVNYKLKSKFNINYILYSIGFAIIEAIYTTINSNLSVIAYHPFKRDVPDLMLPRVSS